MNENLDFKNQINSIMIEVKENQKENYNSLHTEILNLKNQIKLLNSSNEKIMREILELRNLILYPYIGIQNNIPVSSLINHGYSYVYNRPYNHFTTKQEIDEIKNSCSSTTVLCLGGRDSQNANDILLVVSCGLCSAVFTKTARNTPNLHNEAYWYYTPDLSGNQGIGFSPNATINQYNVDVFDQSNNQRVSWHLTGNWGGWRLGSLTSLDLNTRYYKVILKR